MPAKKKADKKAGEKVLSWAEREALAKAAKIKQKEEAKRAKASAALKAEKAALWALKDKADNDARLAEEAEEDQRINELAAHMAPACGRLKNLKASMMQWKERHVMNTLKSWKDQWLEHACEEQDLGNSPLPAIAGGTAWHCRASSGSLEVLKAMKRRENGLMASYQVFGRVRRHLTKSRMNVRKIFCSFDEDRSGVLGPNELRSFLAALEVELEDEEFLTMVSMIDQDGSNEIDLQEFMDAMVKFGDKGEAMQNRKKASCDVGDHLGRTPMHYAAHNGHWQVVQFLIDYMGANKEWKDNNGNTPLLVASNAAEHQTPMIRFLVDDMRVDVSVVNNDGWGAMHLAARRGYHKIVRHFVQEAGAHPSGLVQGIDPTLVLNGWTALHLACLSGNTDTVQFLACDCGVPLGAKTSDGSCGLHLASYNGHLEVVKLLINGRAQVTERDEAGATALHLAAMQGFLPVVKFLVDVAGCHPAVQTSAGATPLYLACKKNQIEIVRWLSASELDQSGSSDGVKVPNFPITSPDLVPSQPHPQIRILDYAHNSYTGPDNYLR